MTLRCGDDEQALWDAMTAGEYPRYAAVALGIPPGRAEAICVKWALKGAYTYDTAPDLGRPLRNTMPPRQQAPERDTRRRRRTPHV